MIAAAVGGVAAALAGASVKRRYEAALAPGPHRSRARTDHELLAPA